MKLITTLLSLALLAGCSSTEKKIEIPLETPNAAVTLQIPSSVEEAVKSEYRTPENKVRDPYRHPLETLQFFGVQPNMTVVEISPGTGWYTEILAPLLNQNGHYIAATPPASVSSEANASATKFSAWLTAHPEISSHVVVSSFSPPSQVDIAPTGTADMVLTFRNVHNWMAKGAAEAAFEAFYKALKPGGILGVVEHRADANKPQDPKATSGYVRESEILRLAKKAGFKFIAKSEINANPKDTKDYPGGVWTLPPTLKNGEQERALYMAIGESDRQTIKFVKPGQK